MFSGFESALPGQEAACHLLAGSESGLGRGRLPIRHSVHSFVRVRLSARFFGASVMRSRHGPQEAGFFAPSLIAAKPVKPCDGGVFWGLDLLLFLQ